MCLMPAYYPLKSDDFDYSSPFFEDVMSLLSVYNQTQEKWTRDIMQMFDPVPGIIWFALISTFFSFILLYRFGFRILKGKKARPDAIWKTICAYLNQMQFSNRILFISLSSLLLSIFLFFATNWALSSATTSLVKRASSITIQSYDDVLNRPDVDVTIKKVWAELGKIKELEKNSKEYRLFQRSSDTSFRQSFGDYLDQKRVALAREAITKFYGLVLMFLADRPAARTLVKIDEQGSKFTQVFILHKHSDKFFLNVVSHFMINYLEMGCTDYEMKHFASRSAIGFINENIPPSIERKVSSLVEEDIEEWNPISISNTIYLFTLFFVGMILGLIFSFFETSAGFHGFSFPRLRPKKHGLKPRDRGMLRSWPRRDF